MKALFGLIFLKIFLLGLEEVRAQNDTLILEGYSDERKPLRLDPYMAVYEFGHKTKQFDYVKDVAIFKPFSTFDHAHRHSQPVWVRMTIQNTGPPSKSLDYVLYLGNRFIEDMFEERNGKVTRNNFWDTSVRSSPLTTTEGHGILMRIQSGETVTFWIKSSDTILSNELTPVLYSPAAYYDFKKEHSYSKLFHYSYLCLVIGLCLFLGLMAFTQAIYNRDTTYFFWALYLWSNFIVFFTALDYTFEMGLISSPRHPWTIVSQYIIQVFYLLFLSSFLEIRKYNARIYRMLLALVVLVLIAIIFAIYAVSQADAGLREYADRFTLVTAMLILALFIWIVRTAIPQTNLLVIGSFGALFAGIEAAVFDQFDLSYYGIFWLDPFVFFSLGVLFELIFFSLALSQRTRLIQIENQQLQRNYTKQLEQDLATRVETIQHQNSLLEEQRVLQLTQDFEQKIAETEITALRTQMNPHFIFNCLNSIKLYTLENKSEEASDYLTKFSRLIRLVLENSRSEKVTLENELETLSLYAEMEVMRFKNKLQYELVVSPEIDQLFIEIPPLLLQPFVENAIWHGLMHKEDGGVVKVDVTMSLEKVLHVEVTDNGIGRKKSAEYKSKSATRNKSFGMKVTNERIELINQIYRTHTLVHVLDMEDPAGRSLGTKVVIDIPV